MPATFSGQMFSIPENDGRIMTSWERFLSGGESGSDALRRLIDDSWRRCYGASVDPGRYQAPEPIAEQSLHSLRNECSDLVTAGAPVMASARDFLSETGTVMVLTDQAGTILNLEGDINTRDAAENVHLLSGANWSELTCGTNAIGTALAVGQPIQIHSAEHYCEGIKRWSCSATVVRDPCDGSIIGVIDVSGLSASYSRQSLALVVATAGRIENRLAKIEMEVRYRLLENCVGRLNGSSSDGVIVFDRRGRAIKTNGYVANVLEDMGVEHDAADSDNLSGLSLDWARGSEQPEKLPEWMRREWLEPVILNGERVGAVLTLPTTRRGGARAASPLTLIGDADDKGAFDKIVGESAVIMQSVGRARQLAKSRVPVLLLGETGVGKDVFARCIHESGVSKDAPFVALNCGGFSRELLTSELFGYADGAFTGARRGGMIGKVEAADGGTLFLDEFGEMPFDLQSHFLRVLEEGEVYRLGEHKPRKVKFRLIAATNRDLRQEVQEGRFRMDLFYRVAVTSIHIPSLRERASDVPQLADFFIKRLSKQHGLEPKRLSPSVLDLLSRYRWPGNIRELRNVVESMVVTSHDRVLTEADLPPEIWAGNSHLAVPAPAMVAAMPEAAPDGRDLTNLESVEREAILRAIKGCRGNMTAVARELGIAKSTVYVKLKRFGLESLVEDLRSFRV